MEAEHYESATNNSNVSYATLPDYGRTLSGVTLWPNTAPPQTTAHGPQLTYSFHSFTVSDNATIWVYIGPSLNFDPLHPLN